MTSLNSILPLVDNYLKSAEILPEHEEPPSTNEPSEENSLGAVENARFVLHQVSRLEIAAVSRGESSNMTNEEVKLALSEE
jgi:hypothetical protein